MEAVGKRVDYRDAGELRELLEFAVLEDPRNNAMHPTREVSRHIRDGLALTEARKSLIEKNGRSAQAAHSNLERHTCPQRGLLQNQS